MTPFDIHYLICLSENRTFFYWRAFAKPASLASKNNNKVSLLSSTDVELPTPRVWTTHHILIPRHTQSVLHTKPLTSALPRALHRVHALDAKKKTTYMRVLGRYLRIWTLNHHLIFTSSHLLFSISISFSNMTSSSKERYFGNVTKSRRSSPGESVFFQGQGGRTVLPPLADSFPTLRFPGLFFM